MQETEPAPQEQFDIDAHLDKYARFHEYFVGLAGSAALVDLHRRVNTASMIMSVTGERAIGARRLRARCAERLSPPLRLLDAYEAGDLTAAIGVIRHHIDDALAFTRRHIEVRRRRGLSHRAGPADRQPLGVITARPLSEPSRMRW